MELIYEVTSNIITQAKEKALRDMAFYDGLTHIANRRGFEEYINNNIKRGIRYNVFSFDLNGLKKVNDTYGHTFGDDYIKAFAQELKAVYKNGFCARVGGDEFIAVSDFRNSVQDIYNTLNNRLDKYNKTVKNELKLDYSVGCQIYDPIVDNIDDVMKHADENMYKMKENVKNNK
jgi:diguanylate cyclase (GGDEF)-like protein